LAVAAAKVRAEELWLYPDPASTALRRAIGKVHGLDPDAIVCGNGSEELLDVVARVYARPGDEVLFPEFGFMQFPTIAERVGAAAVRAPEREFVADVDALLKRATARTKLVFLANPNNPTGTAIPLADLRRLRDGLRGDIVLLVDAAYAEYATQHDYAAGHELVTGRDNVVVTRTFSKAYGLAALRVGWAHCPPAMARLLNRVRGVGNINAMAQEAALAALSDREFLAQALGRSIEMRERVGERYRKLGLKPLPSQGNFFAVGFPAEPGRRAADAHAHLARAGIWVRALADCGMPDHLRITLGTEADNDALFRSLEGFLGRNA
jgi:histidinol-phosphate aminotransferase